MHYFGPATDVALFSPEAKFGMSLVAALGHEDHAIFIHSIKPGSVAAMCGLLKVHDRVLAVNGIDVTNGNQDEVVGLIQASGRNVELRVAPFVKTKKQRASMHVPRPAEIAVSVA